MTKEIRNPKLITTQTQCLLAVRTQLDVLPMYGDPLISVRGALLMIKA